MKSYSFIFERQNWMTFAGTEVSSKKIKYLVSVMLIQYEEY